MLLLCGGTGDLGGRIARRLSDEGIPFRALVRPGTSADTVAALGAEIVRGDLTDPASLDAALSGVETVVTTANAIGRLLAGATDVSIRDVDGTGNQNLIERASAAGVERFVLLSMCGLTEETARLAPLAKAKLAAEQRLQETGMRAVIVRPDKFQGVWLSPATGIDPAKGAATIYGHGRTPERYVAEDDVAALVVALVTEPDPPSLVEFGGPEALTREQVCDLVDEAFGVRMRRRHIPRAVLRVGSAALAPVKPHIASLMGMALYYDIHAQILSDTALTSRGIEPRPTTMYLRELASADR